MLEGCYLVYVNYYGGKDDRVLTTTKLSIVSSEKGKI
ncbi:DUF2135 domain-containing protein [Yersinia aldovae]